MQSSEGTEAGKSTLEPAGCEPKIFCTEGQRLTLHHQVHIILCYLYYISLTIPNFLIKKCVQFSLLYSQLHAQSIA
jgi:hypothetical protein